MVDAMANGLFNIQQTQTYPHKKKTRAIVVQSANIAQGIFS